MQNSIDPMDADQQLALSHRTFLRLRSQRNKLVVWLVVVVVGAGLSLNQMHRNLSSWQTATSRSLEPVRKSVASQGYDFGYADAVSGKQSDPYNVVDRIRASHSSTTGTSLASGAQHPLAATLDSTPFQTPATPPPGASDPTPSLDEFNTFATKLVSYSNDLFTSAAGRESLKGGALQMTLTSTDIRKTDSAVYPMVYQMTSMLELRFNDQASLQTVTSVQYTHQNGYWKSVKSTSKYVYDATNSHSLGIESENALNDAIDRAVQGLP